jgi:hypothetical protein
MKIIFLDFDGVLNSETFFVKRYRNMQDLRMIDVNSLNESNNYIKYMLQQIDLDKLDLLKELIDSTDSKIVVISSWKYSSKFDDICKHLINLGIPIIGATKDNMDDRGQGIKDYLNNHDVSNYIIIDDEIFPDYDDELMQHMVKTEFYGNGLNKEHIDKSIELLNDKELKMRRKHE